MAVALAVLGSAFFSLIPVACGDLFGSEQVSSGMAINFAYQGTSSAVAYFCSGEVPYLQQYSYICQQKK